MFGTPNRADLGMFGTPNRADLGAFGTPNRAYLGAFGLVIAPAARADYYGFHARRN